MHNKNINSMFLLNINIVFISRLYFLVIVFIINNIVFSYLKNQLIIKDIFPNTLKNIITINFNIFTILIKIQNKIIFINISSYLNFIIIGLQFYCILNILFIIYVVNLFYIDIPGNYNLCNNSITECSICLNKINTPAQDWCLPCNHYFHKSCIILWFKNKRNCPLCRKNF